MRYICGVLIIKNQFKPSRITVKRFNMMEKISFKRVNSDVYGNPRYVTHFLNFVTVEEVEGGLSILELYDLAHRRAKSLGYKKYRGKDFGGGFVTSFYHDSCKEAQIISNFLKNL